MKKNRIIVIGGNHHNMLGAIRSLGENNLEVNAVIFSSNKNAFVKKSKYLNSCFIINESESETLNILNSFFIDKNINSILIPTSDFAVYVIDKNYDLLSQNFICPNIDGTKNSIIKYMDKYKQKLIADKFNIKTIPSIYFDIKKNSIDDINIALPVFIKPVSSLEGSKKDMIICNSRDDIEKALIYYEDNNIEKILIQKFLKDIKELNLIGLSEKNVVIIPGVVEKIRVYPTNKGTVSYGKVKRCEFYNIDNFINLFKELKYTGMFDIDIFVVNGDMYLNEINFRNSANSYIFNSQRIPLLYIYVMNLLENNFVYDKKIKKDFYFQDDVSELKLLLTGNISIGDYFSSRIKSESFLLRNYNDFKPYLFKYIYAILNKIYEKRD